MKTGVLYMIATPIGNIEDMTFRAVRVLREEVSCIFCEDTRQSKKILNAYGIQLPSYSLHSHSPTARIDEACKRLLNGENIAYLTDCGTPGLSDPGSKLVNAAVNSGIQISPLPGASALTALISAAGIVQKDIIFAGFISKKPGRRINELEKLKQYEGIIVIYESPHRIHKLLAAIAEVFPENELVIGREMTKMYEEFIRGTAIQIVSNPELVKARGEFAIAISNTGLKKKSD